MRRKWIALTFLALFFASCATVVPNTTLHSWGTSKEAYLVATIARTGEPNSAYMQIYEVPSENKIRLHFGGTSFCDVFDRGGDLDSLREALNKYVEWKEQLKDTGGKVSKPIKEIDVFYPNGLHALVLVLSFETDQDGKYYLLISGSHQLIGNDIPLNEDQVLALSQALSQDNILAKAKEADGVANQKATEDAKSQALQQSLK
jgi:hypothetical protein